MKKVDENTPIGTKVVPIDKTVEGSVSLEDCNVWNSDEAKKNGFVYLSKHEDSRVWLNEFPDKTDGNFYNYSDLVLYEQPNALHEVVLGNTKSQPEFKLDPSKHFNTLPVQLPPAIQDRIKELEEEVKRLKERYEPYDIGELYAFAMKEEEFENGIIAVGKLTDFDGTDKNSRFEINNECWYKYARKIKTIELCQ
jgi:hypothetical protein